MAKETQATRGAGAPPHPEVCAELAQRISEFRDKVDGLGRELDEFRRKIEDLESVLAAAPAAAGEEVARREAPAEPEEKEDERSKYLEGIQDRFHGLLHAEVARLEQEAKSSSPPADAQMVCPSCGMLVPRDQESCPQCGAPTEPAPGGGRSFPLSAEKFLYVFNDRFGWFIKTCDKAMHYADRKNDYEKAIDLLRLCVQFMEENLDLLKSKHRDFKLALGYAYLGRCYFQSGQVRDAIEHYKKGILLKAGNSYNCEIGLTAVYRDLVRQIRESGKPFTPKSHPYLSRLELETLNSLGTQAST